MKVGSLVSTKIKIRPHRQFPNDIMPVPNEIYTVRSTFQNLGLTWIRLSEIKNKRHNTKDHSGEAGFLMNLFEEIQAPMNLSKLFSDQLKPTNENRVRK